MVPVVVPDAIVGSAGEHIQHSVVVRDGEDLRMHRVATAACSWSTGIPITVSKASESTRTLELTSPSTSSSPLFTHHPKPTQERRTRQRLG
jgi:hypothetical protein